MPFGGITNVRTNPYVCCFYLCLGVLYLNPLLGNLRQSMQAEDTEQKKTDGSCASHVCQLCTVLNAMSSLMILSYQ